MIDCNWDNPGQAPFRGGDTVAAVESYNFPTPAKLELVYKIQKGYNDATVYITRDEIKTAFGAADNLRDMHFSGGKKCYGYVSRSTWPVNHEQKALVYCSGQYCLAVPVICGNISRIDYFPKTKKDPQINPKIEYHSVPEPSTYLLVLPLLGYTIWRRRLFGRAPGCNPVVG